jgi:YbbR domain-containing protein
MFAEILTKNIGWKLLSLAAATVLWISVATEPELATVRGAPVEYKGIPDDLEISSNIVDRVSIEMRGPAGRLRDLGAAAPGVVLDFSSVHRSGERTFNLDARNVSLPRGIQLVRVIPAQLRFDFERRVEREVPVEVRLSAAHPGYKVITCDASPPKVKIVGPQSAADRTLAVVTDPVDISGVVSSAQYGVNTYLAERLVRFESSSHVVVRVAVKKK